MIVRLVLMLVILGFSSSLPAIDSEPAFIDSALQARYDRLTKEIRCLKCQNQPIADSNSDIASDLRRQVKEMIEAGKSDQEILDYMVARFGDFVLYRPPVSPRTWLLWGGPFLFLVVGLLVAIAVIAKKSRLVDEEDDSDLEEAG